MCMTPEEGHFEKDVKSKMVARLMVEILITVNLVPNPGEATQIHLNCCY